MKHLSVYIIIMWVILMLTACGAGESKEIPSMPEQSIEVMEAQKTINEMIRVDKTTEEDPEGLSVADMILSRAEIRVMEAFEDEWQVKITAPDMQSIADRIRMEIAGLNVDGTDPDEIQRVVEKLTEEMETILRSGEYDTVETFLRLKVVNGEPIMDEEAVDALYGGLVSVYQDLLQEYMGVMDYVIE